MIIHYFYNIIRFKKWKVCLLICLFIVGVKIWDIPQIKVSVMHLLELEKCPACYGISACNDIHEIDITPSDLFSLFSYLFGVKNVYFGLYKGDKVILKKLAHTSELEAFDQMLCERDNLKHLCVKSFEARKNDQDFYILIERDLMIDFTEDNRSHLRLCPTTEHLDILLHNVYLNNKGSNLKSFEINIWTLITINPEPILLQILHADDGWPVPKYLGACGRIIVEEYVGLPLKTYYYESWIRRAKIASSLLHAADMFTFRNKNFGFYLTDVSADNIAVNSEDVAIFVDLENVIVVDKNVSSKVNGDRWYDIQENIAEFDCLNYYTFSPIDICSHYLSDHNYYSICQVLLSVKTSENSLPGGLLHDIPKKILKQYPSVKSLIEQCSYPTSSQTRINSGMELKTLLDTILEKSQIT